MPKATGKYLTFILAGGHYGIPILGVREIIAVQPITPLPRMPDAVRGVINLRGKIIPVVDLRSCLRVEAAEYDRATCIVVLDVDLPNQGPANIGVIVNAVREVTNIDAEDLQAPPTVGGAAQSEFIMALAKPETEEHVITLLDTVSVLESLFGDGQLPGAAGMTRAAESSDPAQVA